jgi:uncharacterized delta-60 repeat protein
MVLASLGCSGSTGADEEQVATASEALTHGSLDTTFNKTGELFANPNGDEQYNDVKIDGNGRLVAVGAILPKPGGTSAMNLKVARVLPNGTMDNTFATNGVFTYQLNSESAAYACAILPSSGNILVVGQTLHNSAEKIFVLQLTSAGKPVGTFGTGGVVELNVGTMDDSGEDISIDQNGRILIAGYTRARDGVAGSPSEYSQTWFPIVVRVLPNGTLDKTFGNQTPKNGVAEGTVVWDKYDFNSQNVFHRLILQPDGSIVGVGNGTNSTVTIAALMEKFTSAGAIDTTFGTSGRVSDAYLGVEADYRQAARLSNGNILAAGYSAETQGGEETVVAEYNPAGRLVSTFGSGGKATYLTSGSDGRSVAIQADGKILVGGAYPVNGSMNGDGGASGGGGYVLRTNPNGSLDTTFGTKGIVSLPGGVNSLALDSNQKIVGAGFVTFSVISPHSFGSALYRLLP